MTLSDLSSSGMGNTLGNLGCACKGGMGAYMTKKELAASGIPESLLARSGTLGDLMNPKTWGLGEWMLATAALYFGYGLVTGKDITSGKKFSLFGG